MRVLIDTHTLLWAVDEPSKIGAMALTALQDPINVRFLSAATIWELAIKVGQGKIVLSMPFRQWMDTAIADLKLIVLPVTVEYADKQVALPPHHKDPFDRMIIAQVLVEGISIASIDVALDAYGVSRIWH